MSLEKVLENPRVWRGSSQVGTRSGLASGYPELDRCLPGGGWPPEALTEILIGQYGIGELRLLMPALARLSAEEAQAQTEPRWIAWVDSSVSTLCARIAAMWHRSVTRAYRAAKR